MPQTPETIPPSYLVSIGYDGDRKKCFLRFYDPSTHRIHFWFDDSDHKPYCYSKQSAEALQKIDAVVRNPGFDHFEGGLRFDALRSQQVKVTKIVAKDPLTIGGKPTGSIRDSITAWEADIKYVENYIYDRGLEPGMMYEYKNKRLTQTRYEVPDQVVKELERLMPDEATDYKELAREWTRLLECPVPQYRRVAVDIEVYQQVETRIPDPELAEHPVICVSLVGSDGASRVLLLRRQGVPEGEAQLPASARLEFYDTEQDLLIALFSAFLEYPFIVTFNGDDFDLKYLYHRAQRLGFRNEEIPIEMGRDVAFLKYGVHIDLYKFFFNRSIQIYAFGQKYRDVTLDDVGEALVGMTKIELTKGLNDLTYTELAQYCVRDAEITLRLTSFDNDLVMKLILAITRISRMPMEDVSRQGVSRWIRNFLQFEHRRLNMLIPNTDDILAVKGKTATKAIIKGKKYKGAIVVEPVPGVHFNVAVMDFPSLYPSLIKVYNLGYQSILCPHEECKSNKVPDTPNWVCTKRPALESLLIGSLRDLRVKWYKSKAKDKTLSSELRSWYNVIQAALKVILNASYGVFGAETFDLYCPPVAEATAALGRHSITQIINEAKNLGIPVIYGDTDSIFLKNPSESQINSLAKWSEKELHMELDVDKVYRYAVFSSRKKNYLGVTMEGTVDVKGLTGKKKHIPPFIKEAFDLMKTRLAQVETPVQFEDAKKEIRNIVRDSYLRLKRREWKRIEDLAFNVVLGEAPDRYIKTIPQHVRAAKILEEKKYELKAGDLISFVKVVKEPHVKPVQLASNGEIDVEKYVGYLHSTFDQVLDALGLDFNEIIGLTKLERFM